MLIKTIRVKNFYSFHDVKLDFRDLSGIVRIDGFNKDTGGSNGAGKSVILESIVWGLFGKTVRKSTEESLVNFTHGKECSVVIEVRHNGNDYVIERCKRPTSLNFYVNGITRNRENATETQAFIEECLESDYKSFLASVVFGQHADVDFLSSSPEDKRKIIQSCFSLEELFGKRSSVKYLKGSYTGELKSLIAIKEDLTKKLAGIEKSIPKKKYVLVDLPPLNDILSREKEIASLKTIINSKTSDVAKIKKSVQKKTDAIAEGVYTKTSECPICKNSYEVCQTHESIDQLRIAQEKELSEVFAITSEIVDLEARIESLRPKYSSTEWAKYNEKNVQLREESKNVELQATLQSQIDSSEVRIKELEQKIEAQKFWEKAFSEQGLIRYIIRNILDYLNMKSNEYLSLITDNQFSIKFEDNLSETITTNGIQTKFVSLSGGEKKKVNLAIMLALQDLQQKISKTQSNVLFFDEVGENLDEISMHHLHNLLDILRKQDESKVIFVITHSPVLNSLFSENASLKVVKEKGISKILNGSY